jgi:hypothetical protein
MRQKNNSHQISQFCLDWLRQVDGLPSTVLLIRFPASVTLNGNAMTSAVKSLLLVFIVLGVNATNSFGSDVSRFFTGSPTDKAVWMLIGGVAASVAGLVGLTLTLRGSKQG